MTDRLGAATAHRAGQIERAKQLLKHTNRSIVEIALLFGFNRPSPLGNPFRQATGPLRLPSDRAVTAFTVTQP